MGTPTYRFVRRYVERRPSLPLTLKQEGSNMAFRCAESIKYNRATIGGVKSSPDSGFDLRVKYDPMHFDVNSLSRYGK